MKQTWKWRLAQQLEKRWWKRYLKTRDVDEYLGWKRNYWLKFMEPLQQHLDLSKPLTVLDAGCGPAGIFTILNNHKVTAIDPLLDQYEKELRHFDRSTHPNVEFVATPLEAFHPAHPFDLVFCLNAINHVSDIDRAMTALFNSMAPEGKLILSIDCHRFGALKTLFRWIPGDALHPHQDSLEDYEKKIEKLGGNIVLTHREKPGRIFDYYVLVITRQ